MAGEDNRIELSDMIAGLRSELRQARRKARKQELKFSVENIEIEAQVTVEKNKELEASGGWKFWVFSEASLKGTAGVTRECVQKVKLTLKIHDDDGEDVFLSGGDAAMPKE